MSDASDQRLKIVMAVSRDGYMSREYGDTMKWLGPTDKAVFRILTGVGGEIAVGRHTAEHMPNLLEGRNLHVLSRAGIAGSTLRRFVAEHPGGWLAGGPTLALIALQEDYVDEVHLCRSDRSAFPDPRYPAYTRADVLTPWLENHGFEPCVKDWWHLALSTRILDTKVECWHRIWK